MQTSPREYYLSRIKDFEIEIANQKKKLGWLSFSRILTFILIITATYFLFGNWAILIPIGLTVITLFLILIHHYNNLKREFAISKELLLLNKEEIEVLDWKFDHRDGGNEFIDTSHPFSYDIDLYGRGSFFQYMNRTSLESGKKFLSALLNSNSIEGIQDRQKSIIELQNMPDWRQRYSAISKLINDKFTTQQITNWIVNYNPFLNKAHYILAIVFTFISPILIVLTALQTVGPNLLGYWLLGGLIITGSQLKKINVLSDKCSKSIDTFQNYAHLIDLIEKREFSSKELQAQSFRLIYKNKKASLEIKKFSKILDAFDNRNNLISAIFGNGLFLYDLWQVRRIENWIKVNNTSISTWFEVVHFFDALNSLGNFSFNHPNFNFPTVDLESENTISATHLGHPLIRPEVRISSDLTIQTEQFFIVTGANMAGKSTFLRSVSLFIIMANSGLPVCSDRSIYRPIKLITSMRTSDSLSEESSYFFSELSRLKIIVDKLEKENYFIILDEILKGTNSTDKAKGSKKFVERLVNFKATGIIATHDLSLCEAANESPNIENYYFDAEIVDDELFFDYRLKKGICQNMNASFLLKKMNIV